MSHSGNITRIVPLIRYLVDGRKSISLFPVILAYTSPLNFDQIINQHCIQMIPGLLQTSVNPQDTLSSSIFYFIAALNFDPMLRPRYAFLGRVYRGLTMGADYIRTMKRNEIIVNRIFISTFRNIAVANRSIGFDQSNQYRRTQSRDILQADVRITYQIHRPETRAINITHMSAYSGNEEEILLMPISAFRIIDIRSDANGLHFDVTMEDCELPTKDDPLAPIIRCDFAEFPDRPLLIPPVQVKMIAYTPSIITVIFLSSHRSSYQQQPHLVDEIASHRHSPIYQLEGSSLVRLSSVY